VTTATFPRKSKGSLTTTSFPARGGTLSFRDTVTRSHPIGSKLVFRAPVGNGHTQHFFNPSNLGVGATLLIPDPATTPLKRARPAWFGLAVAAVYGVIQTLHLVFGLFYALLVVAAIRGLSLHVFDLRRNMREKAVGPGAGTERLELRPD
jgi:hypothetical protein